MALATCPRCKKRVLERNDCGESSIYGSRHLLCNPCWEAEEEEIEEKGTNDLPDTLASYGAANDW